MKSDETGKNKNPAARAEKDAARLGRRGGTPVHDRMADEGPDSVDWDRVAATEEFKSLIKAKLRFILPATVFFILYYFTLPVLVGYAPEFMKTEVIGSVNIAYLFALSQFFLAWIIAALYIRAAGRHDAMTRGIVEKLPRLSGKT
jgi:uncharacterized membrane protein (DUF485 family)